MQSLTDKQKLVLAAIQRHIALTGHSPTVREIGAAVDLRSSCSVQKHLDSLERLGTIQRTSFKYRSIELVENACGSAAAPPWMAAGLMVPLLGQASGGVPSALPEAQQNNTRREAELLFVPPFNLGSTERSAQADACAVRNYEAAPYFALSVKGDSMRDAGIGDGDIVVVRRQRTAASGEIVIARIDGAEPMVKRLFSQGRVVRLDSDNPSYKPIVARDAKIIGRVTMSIKRF